MAEEVGSIYYKVEADTSDLLNSSASVDKSLDEMNKRFGQTDRAARGSAMQMKKTSAAVQGLGRHSQFVARELGKLLGGIVSLRTAAALVKMADSYNEMAERIRMATASAAEYNTVQDRLLQTANGTYRALSEAQEVYIQTADSLRSMGYETTEVLDITDSLSYTFVKNATSADKAKTTMDAFTKAVNRGKVDVQGWQSILSAVPTIVDDIASASGRSTAQVRELGFAGDLTAKMLTEGLRRSLASNKKAADDMATTVGDAMVAVRNSLTVLVGKMNQASGVTNDLADSIVRVAEAIQDVDVQTMVRELDSIKATISLISGEASKLFSLMGTSSEEASRLVGRSFSQMALTTAKELDGIYKVFQGTAGAVGAAWEALANNIPAYFTNAWNDIKREAAGFVNALADIINKPLQALGQEGLGKVSFGASAPREIKSLMDAAAEGWNNAAVGVGAYERTLDRITRNAIWGSVSDWVADYSEITETASKSASVVNSATKESIKLQKDNAKVIANLREQLLLAALSGEELAIAKERMRLNPAATPEEVAEVERLASALYRVEELKKLRNKVGDKPLDYIRGDESPLSGGAFDDQYARYEAEAQAEQERYAAQLERLREALEAQKLTQEEYQAEFERLAQRHADRLDQIDQAKVSTMLKTAEQGFGSMADILRQSHGEQSRIYRAMFAVSKAFAVADATINAYNAISKAWASAPFPANLAAVAATTPAVMSVVSAISGANYSGRQYGGPVGAGKMYRINETGAPEVLNTANGQQFLLPNTRGEVVSNKNAKSGGEAPRSWPVVNLIENQDRAGEVERRGSGDDEQLDIFVADIRGGGKRAQALEYTYGLRRAGS